MVPIDYSILLDRVIQNLLYNRMMQTYLANPLIPNESHQRLQIILQL